MTTELLPDQAPHVVIRTTMLMIRVEICPDINFLIVNLLTSLLIMLVNLSDQLSFD